MLIKIITYYISLFLLLLFLPLAILGKYFLLSRNEKIRWLGYYMALPSCHFGLLGFKD